MKIPFYKCNGNGNSFIIIIHNNILEKSFFNKQFIQKICLFEKNKLVDGLILLNIKKNKIIMDYFNNDGSWETFCLNGLRCSSLLLNKKFSYQKNSIFCNNNLYETKILGHDNIEVKLSKPTNKIKKISIEGFVGDYIDTGAKHFVISYNEKWPSLEKLKNISKKIRLNKTIFPNGINVNFYKIIDSRTIEVKTYEKGIESMMLSCASGSYACAYHYFQNNNIFGEIEVQNDGGNFQITFDENYSNNTLAGHAEIEYEDLIEIN